MNIEHLKKILTEKNQPKFRLKQIEKAVYQDGVSAFREITSLPKNLREELDKEIKILSFEVEKILASSDKNSFKASLKLLDGKIIETVMMSSRPGFWSVCLSSQVGCAMNCAFCATGQNGFSRNLSAEEIADQVLFWKQYLKKIKNKNYNISNIVYMGMGEPFLNWENVSESLRVLMDPEKFNFRSRSISLSTVGVKGGLIHLQKDFPQINLAISLHFADNKVREKFMPANRQLNLQELKGELEEYFQKSNRKVFLEYILFSGLNDGKKEAIKLEKYIKSFKKKHLLHVNLINYNSTEKGKFKSPGKEQAIKFRNYLLKNKINCTIRKSLGEDIQGACGQLAGKK